MFTTIKLFRNYIFYVVHIIYLSLRETAGFVAIFLFLNLITKEDSHSRVAPSE